MYGTLFFQPQEKPSCLPYYCTTKEENETEITTNGARTVSRHSEYSDRDVQLLRQLQKFQCSTEAFWEETVFEMGLEFDFNQW